MAKLIKCSDCGKKISKNSNSCPNCGAPTNYSAELSRTISKASSNVWSYIIGIFFILSGLGAFSTGFLQAVMIISGGVLALPIARQALINRNFTTSHKPFVIASVVLILVGTVSLMLKKESNHQKYLQENPEAYAAEQSERAEKDKQEETKKEQDKVSDMTLFTHCEINIKNSLKNPKSFDSNFGSRKIAHTSNGYTVSFSYTGTNSFNATLTSVATCNFDKNGRMTSMNSI